MKGQSCSMQFRCPDIPHRRESVGASGHNYRGGPGLLSGDCITLSSTYPKTLWLPCSEQRRHWRSSSKQPGHSGVIFVPRSRLRNLRIRFRHLSRMYLTAMLAWDVLEIRDVTSHQYEILSAVCQGTTYHQAWVARTGDTTGPPSSLACLKAFTQGWVRWAGWPSFISCDRGTHTRGISSQTV